jgi:hypothetical protein
MGPVSLGLHRATFIGMQPTKTPFWALRCGILGLELFREA